ncbi:MAG: succinate dehydrogenase, hydrophobic membrane anchor protein [Pseudomonadales bacterium]|nr:succinate dehydrogenase, hydrophobic membrane anchor protein [Pseudomonadales bacterium]
MVSSATSLTRSGLSDFIVQRVSAFVLAAYTLCIVGSVLVTPGMDYATWLEFQSRGSMRMFGTLAVFALAAHAWIGMWTIGTDYIRDHYFGSRSTTIRGLYQVLCAGAVFIYVAWGVDLFWSL